MTAAPAATAPGAGLGDERAALIDCLHAALAALEQQDDAAWRSAVDALIQWRSQPLVLGLVKLARELEQALGTGSGGGSLAEACLRLEHVVKVSEDASHHTLDLIQECAGLLATLPGADAEAHAATLAGIRSRLSEMTAAQGYQDLTGQIIRRVVELVRTVDAGLGAYAPGDARPLQLSSQGHGPSIQGLDAPAASQDDANSLLSSLGL
ncbi:protein phosphatase CheZ [Luteimonas sp. SDU82]|uniref:protein phosphatase CheZ n=1 Tax=Luteimonas sp. SDU82 TaxID=3422592 RepID=UPI003EC0AAD1